MLSISSSKAPYPSRRPRLEEAHLLSSSFQTSEFTLAARESSVGGATVWIGNPALARPSSDRRVNSLNELLGRGNGSNRSV